MVHTLRDENVVSYAMNIQYRFVGYWNHLPTPIFLAILCVVDNNISQIID